MRLLENVEVVGLLENGGSGMEDGGSRIADCCEVANLRTCEAANLRTCEGANRGKIE